MHFLGNYRGKILNNTGEKGQCKIYVPSIHPIEIEGVSSDSEAYSSKLPWAEPAVPLFAGNSDNKGMCSWPDIGAWVWVFFEGGDIRRPVYFSGINGGNAWVSENNKQYVVQTGKTKLVIDDNTGEVTLIVAKGVNINTPVTTINGKLHVTGDIKGDSEVQDKTRNMSADRVIFNSHPHIDSLGNPTSLPTVKQ